MYIPARRTGIKMPRLAFFLSVQYLRLSRHQKKFKPIKTLKEIGLNTYISRKKRIYIIIQ